MITNRPYLNIDIPGIERILPPDGKIYYYSEDILNMVIHGAPGSGKTHLALQMGLNIAANHSKGVIYLTKDTNPISLFKKMALEFGFFSSIEMENEKELNIVDDPQELNGNDGLKELSVNDTNFISFYKYLLANLMSTQKETFTLNGNDKMFSGIGLDIQTLQEDIDMCERSAANNEDKTKEFKSELNKKHALFKYLLEIHFSFIKDNFKALDGNRNSKAKGISLFSSIIDILHDSTNNVNFDHLVDFYNDKSMLRLYIHDLNNTIFGDLLRYIFTKNNELKNEVESKLKEKLMKFGDIFEPAPLNKMREMLLSRDIPVENIDLESFINIIISRYKYKIQNELFKKENNKFYSILFDGDNEELKGKYEEYILKKLASADYIENDFNVNDIIKFVRPLLSLCKIFRWVLNGHIIEDCSNLPIKLNVFKDDSRTVRFNILDSVDTRLTTIFQNAKTWHGFIKSVIKNNAALKEYFKKIHRIIPDIDKLSISDQDEFVDLFVRRNYEEASEQIEFYFDKVKSSESLKQIITDLVFITELDPQWGSYFALCEFNPNALENISIDRYSENIHTAIQGIERLCPNIAPILSWLVKNETNQVDSANGKNKQPGNHTENNFVNIIEGIRHFWQNQLVIICDSISPQLLEQHIHLQQEHYKIMNRTRSNYTNPMNIAKPIWIFVLESGEMPQIMNCTFPPDIQIQLSSRKIDHNVLIRTIQIHKARYQELIRESFPYIIVPEEDQQSGNKIIKITKIISEEKMKNKKPDDDVFKWDPDVFAKRRAGISVLPSVSAFFPYNIQKESKNNDNIEFGSQIDGFLTQQGYLTKGGTTLVLTENRCLSTALSLHYLLGQYKPKKSNESNKPNTTDNNDVLYISLDSDLKSLIDIIFSYDDLKESIFGGDTGATTRAYINQFLQDISNEKKYRGKYMNLFYRVPFSQNGNQNLFIMCPQLSWKTIEEVLESVNWILNEDRKWNIKRVVFNRVSRIKTCWPLIDEPELLITNIGQLCRFCGIDFMIVDDTADQSASTGHLQSNYFTLADNIIRLKRVSIRGMQTVAIEVTRTHGTSPKYHRPLEMLNAYKEGKITKELRIKDTFRGYSGIYTDTPKHCKIKLVLPYDSDNTALKTDVEQIKFNLELVFDDIEVMTLGPHQMHGTNSAIANLANITHDTCHVCAVDEVWLSQLLGNKEDGPALSELKGEELLKIVPNELLPENIRKAPEKLKLETAGIVYTTQAITIAQNNIPLHSEYPHAVPYYHNWGIFVVCQPTIKVVNVVNEIVDNLPNGELNEEKESIKAFINNKIINETQSSIKNIHDVLWDIGSDVVPVTWKELREFKLNYWDVVLTELSKPENQKIIKDKFPDGINLKFFSFICTSQESIVSFFIELLLSQGNCSSIFEPVLEEKPNVSQIIAIKKVKFKSDNDAIKIIYDTLILLKNLLSEEDQRHIGLGLTKSPFDATSVSIKKHIGDSLQKAPVEEEKIPTISLFSRQWITSIPQLQLKNDLRNRVVLKHLPTENQDALFNSMKFMSQEPGGIHENLKDATKGIGPTMAGTWYIGALKGGNLDLAADIIKELTSVQREQNRIRNCKAAGVYRKSYEHIDASANGNSTERNLINETGGFPYSHIMRQVNGTDGINIIKDKNGGVDKNRITVLFPFSRLCIDKYHEVSLEIYDLVRDVMREDDTSQHQNLVERTLKRIEKLYNPTGKVDGEGQ